MIRYNRVLSPLQLFTKLLFQNIGFTGTEEQTDKVLLCLFCFINSTKKALIWLRLIILNSADWTYLWTSSCNKKQSDSALAISPLR